MNLQKPSYDALAARVRELEGLLAGLRRGTVDSVVSESDPSRWLVLREYQAELEKERQLAELRAIIETVPTALAIAFSSGEIHLANRAFYRMAGPGTPATVPRWAANLHGPAPFRNKLEGYFPPSGKPPRQPVVMKATLGPHPERQRHWVVTLQPLAREICGRPAVMIACTDVTDQQVLIAQLADAKAQMEDFLAAAAHDLKSPLVTIAHNVTFARMSQGDDLAGDAAECLNRIESAERDMMNLLNQISTVSRAGRDTEPRDLHPLSDLVTKAIRQLEGAISQRKASIHVAEDLPKVYCQGTKFVQVFSNLISNAIKYTPHDRTPLVSIGYCPHRGPEHVCFVRDNGVGIPEDCLERIFGLFERLSPGPGVPGQGVGLTVVKRIVEFHGGRVWAESVPGEGSTFYFSVGRQKVPHHDSDLPAADHLFAG